MNINQQVKLLALTGFLLFTNQAYSETHEVAQKNKQFSVKALEVKVGDKVKFVNQDDFFHNIFSLSDTKFFDLGSFPKGEFKEVTFEQAGLVEVECAIHPEMFMKVHVKE